MTPVTTVHDHFQGPGLRFPRTRGAASIQERLTCILPLACQRDTRGPAKVPRSSERLVPVPVYSLQGYITVNATRTGCGVGGVELDISGVVLAPPSAEAEIAARGEDASSTRTEHREQVTHSGSIF